MTIIDVTERVTVNPLKTMSAQVEAAVMDVLARPIRLSREYELREADAVAFKAGNYLGTPGRVLLGFATASGRTAQAAADLVLAQANGFRQAELDLADLRMMKYAVELAESEAQALEIFNQTMAAIAAIAKQIG